MPGQAVQLGAEQPPLAAAVRRAEGPGESSMTLLLIEDDELDAHRIERWLRRLPDERWTLAWAGTLEAGLAGMDTHRPDVVLLDLSLPDASGLEAVGEVLRHADRCAVIVQTGLEDQAVALEAIAMGAQDFLEKDAMTQESLARSVRYATTRQRLRDTADALERTDAELEEFAHVLAHDLRAPVRTARLLADQLVAHTAGSSAMGDELGTRLDESLERVDRMILSMLEYSGLRLTEVDPAPVSLNLVAREVTGALEAELKATDGRIENMIDPAIMVRGDGPLLERLLLNVCANSLRYHRPGLAPVVRLEAEVDRGRVVVTATDNGIGVAPGDCERIFGMLERLRADPPGLGFGLSICRRIVTMLGGTIVMVPTEPPGACVRIELPASRGATT